MYTFETEVETSIIKMKTNNLMIKYTIERIIKNIDIYYLFFNS